MISFIAKFSLISLQKRQMILKMRFDWMLRPPMKYSTNVFLENIHTEFSSTKKTNTWEILRTWTPQYYHENPMNQRGPCKFLALGNGISWLILMLTNIPYKQTSANFPVQSLSSHLRSPWSGSTGEEIIYFFCRKKGVSQLYDFYTS
jgi:hypothetical protein